MRYSTRPHVDGMRASRLLRGVFASLVVEGSSELTGEGLMRASLYTPGAPECVWWAYNSMRGIGDAACWAMAMDMAECWTSPMCVQDARARRRAGLCGNVSMCDPKSQSEQM